MYLNFTKTDYKQDKKRTYKSLRVQFKLSKTEFRRFSR